jgi:hypothetical protein
LAALKALLTRQVLAQDEKAEADAERKAAEARFYEASKRMTAVRTSFALFGFNTDAEDFWDQVKTAMGLTAWNAAFAKARPKPFGPPPPPPDEDDGEDEKEAGGEQDIGQSADEENDPAKATVRDAVLNYLEAVGDAGMKAAAIRALYEADSGVNLHSKTMGMTLYRLSLQGMVRREGRNWFFVTRSAETENPGGDTPGSEDGQNEEEEA